jgi:predicted ribosomally synthesized peptide with SipW-like signal peptide
MKKKILTLCLVVALAATAVIGGTLAYFSDTDAQKNTFTTGNVAIDLWEDFGDNDENGIEELIPATGSAQKGTLKNGIEKEIYVDNTGSEDAYVRVHIAIPSILDDAQPDFDASKNVLHFNYTPESVQDGKWNWSKTVDGTTGSDWNFYTANIDNVPYNVYVVTYETALKKDEATVDAMSQVYLDSKTTNEDITNIKGTLGDNWYIYVVAEGTQADGFNDAYEALNTAFGDPSTAEGQVTEAEFKAAYENKTWVNYD